MAYLRIPHATGRKIQVLSALAVGILLAPQVGQARETKTVFEPLTFIAAGDSLPVNHIVPVNIPAIPVVAPLETTNDATPTATDNEKPAADDEVQSEAQPEARTLMAEAPAPAAAEAAKTEDASKAAAPADDEKTVRNFMKGLRHRGIAVGYGKQVPSHRFRDRTDVTLYQVIPNWGRFRNSRQELLWELPAVYASQPKNGYAFGFTLMGRQYLSDNRSFAPFLELGCGLVYTNFNEKFGELGGHFQFSPQGGIGARTAISKRGDLVYGIRWYHLSNAGLNSPNTGLNNYLINLGYSQVF